MGEPRYEVTLYSPEDLRWFSFVLAGLFELERAGDITLGFGLSVALHQRGHYETRCGVRDRTTGAARDVVFDLKDSATFVGPRALALADVVYKRNHRAPQPSRVRPFGPFFNARSRHEHDLCRLHAGVLANVLRRVDWRRAHRPRPTLLVPLKYDVWRRVREYASLPFIDDYEAPPPTHPEATEPVVLFQTRVFPNYPHDDAALREDKARVNRQRADLVRLLRRELGPRFIGGLVPDAFARRAFPDALTTLPTERRAYLELARRARVSVYTVGLVGSPGRKLGEALAASACLVAERPSCELAVPLEDGRDVALFDTPDDAVARCRELLDDPERAHAMARAAHAYYLAHARPAAAVARCLARAFSP